MPLLLVNSRIPRRARPMLMCPLAMCKYGHCNQFLRFKSPLTLRSPQKAEASKPGGLAAGDAVPCRGVGGVPRKLLPLLRRRRRQVMSGSQLTLLTFTQADNEG